MRLVLNSDWHLGVHGFTVGLPVLAPCQEVMAVTAGERDPWEKGAKTRQQECGEENSGFSTPSRLWMLPAPGTGVY